MTSWKLLGSKRDVIWFRAATISRFTDRTLISNYSKKQLGISHCFKKIWGDFISSPRG